jgi:C-terminal processing protease CtpA/Prc
MRSFPCYDSQFLSVYFRIIDDCQPDDSFHHAVSSLTSVDDFVARRIDIFDDSEHAQMKQTAKLLEAEERFRAKDRAIFVADAYAGSNAHDVGLWRGDCITHINGIGVYDEMSAIKIIGMSRKHNRDIIVSLRRPNRRFFLIFVCVGIIAIPNISKRGDRYLRTCSGTAW